MRFDIDATVSLALSARTVKRLINFRSPSLKEPPSTTVSDNLKCVIARHACGEKDGYSFAAILSSRVN